MALSPTSSRGGTTYLTLLDSKTGDGTTGTFTFSAISGAYNHLYLVLSGRGDQAATATNFAMTFNATGGTSYDQNYLNFDGTSSSSANSTFGQASNATAGTVTAANATTSYAGLFELFVPNYANTALFKVYRVEAMYETSAAAGGIQRRVAHGTFKSTSAISSIALALSSGNFITGTKAFLYGYS